MSERRSPISQLPDASAIAGTEEFPVVQSGATKRATVDEVLTIPASGARVARSLKDKVAEALSVKDFGAVGDGVADDTAEFTAAAATGVEVTIPPGSYNLASNVTGYWKVAQQVSYTGAGRPLQQERGFWVDEGGANIHRVRDRLLIGDAADGNGKKSPGTGKSWVGDSAGGYMTYFESRAQGACFSSTGGIAFTAAARSSDNVQLGELNTMGVGAYVHNDNTNAADKKSAWALYGHAAQSQANKHTTALELDVCSTVALTSVSPFSMGLDGSTSAAWVGVGGETAQQLVAAGSGATLQNVSAAVAIINSAGSAAGNRFNKGIVFQSSSISGTDGVTGNGTAIELARGHDIVWRFGSAATAVSGMIRNNCAAAATQQRLVFGTSNVTLFGVQSDLSTEVPLFRVQSVTLTGAESTNYFFFNPSKTGDGFINMQAAGADANIDIRLTPAGTGTVDIRKGAVAAASAPAFTATHYLPIKLNGTTYYMPVRNATW